MASRMFRQFHRQLNNVRQYAAHSHAASAGDHGGGSRLWKILSFTVAVPGVIVCYINAHMREAEDHENYTRPEFVGYEHLRIRSKKFPWGDGQHSLFHTHMNALPDGFEESAEEH